MADDESSNFLIYRSMWLDHICIRRDLTHATFRVGYFLASKMRQNQQFMWWGVNSIANEIGMSIATVSDATATLKDKGLIVVTKGAKGSYYYSIRMPIDPESALEIANAGRPHRKKTGGRKRG